MCCIRVYDESMETVAVVSEECSLRCFIHGKGSRMQVAVLDDQLPRDGVAPEEFVDGNDFAGHLCVLVAAEGDGHCSVQDSQCQVRSGQSAVCCSSSCSGSPP